MSSYPTPEKAVLAAWKQRMQTAGRQAGLPLRYSQSLLARFQRHYQALISLPRRARRRLKKKLAMSLAAAALMFALMGAPISMTVNASTVSGDTRIVQVQHRGSRGGDEEFAVPAHNLARQAGAPAVDGGPGATIVVDGTCTLEDAIMAANNDAASGSCPAGSGDDTLDIQVNVNLTAPAPVISSTMTLEGNGNTIAGDDTFGPLLSVNATGDMTLNEATLTGGFNDANQRGGALYVNGGMAEVNDSVVTGNYSSGDGGGMATLNGATLTVNNSEISYNEAPFSGGGGIANRNSTAIITGSRIVENNAYEGGGLFNSYGALNLSDSTISGNQTIQESGGMLIDGGYTSIDNSTISYNTSTIYTGGIDCLRGCNLVMNNSTISGNSNSGTFGGGLYVGFVSSTNVTINDSTITDNSVYGPGAGLYVGNLGQVSISRSIIAGNTNLDTGDASEVLNINTLTVDDYNLFGHAGLTTAQAISGFTPGPTDILATSDGTLPTVLTNILDTVLQNNGGDTETHALTLVSPALDGVADGSCAPSDVDQRYLPRAGGVGMGGDFCDIGAFELQNQSPTDVSLSGFGGDQEGGWLAGAVTAMLATIAAAGAALGLYKRKEA